MFYSGYILNKHVQDSIKVILLYYKQVNPNKNSTRKDAIKHIQASCPTMVRGLGILIKGLA
jgi:hypothetical protein